MAAELEPAFQSLVALAKACYADYGTITSERIREALQHLDPEALAWVAEPGGQRPRQN